MHIHTADCKSLQAEQWKTTIDLLCLFYLHVTRLLQSAVHAQARAKYNLHILHAIQYTTACTVVNTKLISGT